MDKMCKTEKLEQMAEFCVSYSRLWKLLKERHLKKKDLQAMTNLSSAVIAKLSSGKTVHLDTLVKICTSLGCDISDIMEIKKLKKENN